MEEPAHYLTECQSNDRPKGCCLALSIGGVKEEKEKEREKEKRETICSGIFRRWREIRR
jgi:hypothetical protein